MSSLFWDIFSATVLDLETKHFRLKQCTRTSCNAYQYPLLFIEL